MKKAAVIGATGAMGYALVSELQREGVEVFAVCRNVQKADQLFQGMTNVTIVKGDVRDERRLQHIFEKVDVAFISINIPYQNWKDELLPLFGHVFSAAQAAGTKLAVVDNIYSYSMEDQWLTEETAREPVTKKGQLRKQLLQEAEAWQNKGTEILIAHFSDFYGPYGDHTILQQTITSMLSGKRPLFVGPLKNKREFIYTPDGAKALITLARHHDAYQQCWNIPGGELASGEEIIHILRELTGNKKKPFVITSQMIRISGLFSGFMREVGEMMVLTEKPVYLNGAKYEEKIGPLPKTKLAAGLKAVVESEQLQKK
ncbi:SDR family NAD(P)-dependent oxidoreductase [Halalkalibacter oceani]|uniref:SDR family NAD(P)-dependent oxidoreductase n=1 Tax=Halalkalibacter oceani TaxID=1653776 RepID=A0A9X2IN06_9BACI|nr:SDR family NAD(P)-dependent oxidoreductase [Halalkalibacter oceani]MCM3712942.1 SDR family NAD(P)-dependent oxidoreductase [Halalkalibacter oceani]